MQNVRGLGRDSETIKGAKAFKGWIFDFLSTERQIDTLAADLCISRFGIAPLVVCNSQLLCQH
jgi:hypothetical protein